MKKRSKRYFRRKQELRGLARIKRLLIFPKYMTAEHIQSILDNEVIYASSLNYLSSDVVMYMPNKTEQSNTNQ